MGPKVPNHLLLEAGLTLLNGLGKTATKISTGSRSMRYRLDDGSTVRVRTCNDHVLVALAGSAQEGAKLNIEGTDYLLIVMPEQARTHGNVIAYFLPTDVAVAAVRKSHKEWLASRPKTSGDNRTWNVWFDDFGTAWSGFEKKWARYRLQGELKAMSEQHQPEKSGASVPLGDVISAARKQIALAAGVPIDAVKITVTLE